MVHPADHQDHRFIGNVLAVAGTILLIVAATLPPDGSRWIPALLIFASFVLICAVVQYAVHYFAELWQEHELWRRKLDSSKE